VTETQTIRPTDDRTPNWCQWTVGFVGSGSDADTVQMIFQKLNGLNVRVTTAQHPEVIDVQVVDTCHEGPEIGISFREFGMLFVEIDDDGDPVEGAIPVFVRYEDIRSIDIY
jgi:hypothetical protein